MVKTILKWTVLVLLTGYVVAAAVWANGEAQKNACRGIDVEIAHHASVGTDTLSRSGVMAEINRFPGKIVGVQLSSLDTRGLERYLSGYSQFEDVECTVTTNGMLHVKVVPMVPALRVFDGDMSYYINKDGKRMESKASFFVDVPVVSGHFTDSFTPRQLLPVSRFVEQDPVLSKLVGMIHADDADNIILVPRIQGHVINFGDTTRLDEKKLALMTVYRKVMPHKGWDAYDTISVKFRGQVVATRRNKARTDHGGIYDEETDLEEATLPEVNI